MSEPLLLTVTQAARALALSRATTYRMCRAREIPSIIVRGRLRIPVSALERWIADQAITS
jgi:excisionase family DNA binding protein